MAISASYNSIFPILCRFEYAQDHARLQFTHRGGRFFGDHFGQRRSFGLQFPSFNSLGKILETSLGGEYVQRGVCAHLG